MLGLYLHVPFCSSICNYCNFNRGLFDAALKTRYVDALAREIAQAGRAGQAGGTDQAGGARRDAADTIYFGGGTPSLLEPEEIARLVAACRESFDVTSDAEVTLEANPETVTEARLGAYLEAGITRVSFGVQSLRGAELLRLSRLHSADRARAAVAEARAAGVDNLSLDLMMWLPGQSVTDWLESVDGAIALSPDHLSLYLLEVYPNAPLKEEMARSKWSQAPDDDAAAMYVTAMARLDAAGYAQYEISNVARPGRRSRHNLKYWTDGEWLGFGCGAHSTRGGARWKNVASTEDYVRAVTTGAITAVDWHQLSEDERIGDVLFTGLRLTEGVDLEEIRSRYGVDVWGAHELELTRCEEAGLVRRDGSRLVLTRVGMLLAHEVMTIFV